MLTTFCLRLACGMIGCLLLLSSTEVNPRFYRTQYLVALGLVSVAAIAAPSGMGRPIDEALSMVTIWFTLRTIFVPVAVLCCLGFFSWSIDGNPGSRFIGIACVAILVMPLLLIAAVSVKQRQSLDFAVMGIGELASAALLGTAVTAMLLGHSYLIAPGMSLAPLMRLFIALFVATGLRMILAGWGLWSWTAGHSLVNWEDETVLWLPVRWGLGFGGPLVLGWMARSAAKIRSTQSATGILYVVVIFAFLGELTSQLLLANTGYML
jgi:hypothetical protein